MTQKRSLSLSPPLSLTLPPSSWSPLSEWAHTDVSRGGRCLRRTQTVPIPAVTFALAHTMADALGHSQLCHFVCGGLRISLFVLAQRSGRAAQPCQVYTARRRDLKRGSGTNTIKHFLKDNSTFSGPDQFAFCFANSTVTSEKAFFYYYY